MSSAVRLGISVFLGLIVLLLPAFYHSSNSSTPIASLPSPVVAQATADEAPESQAPMPPAAEELTTAVEAVADNEQTLSLAVPGALQDSQRTVLDVLIEVIERTQQAALAMPQYGTRVRLAQQRADEQDRLPYRPRPTGLISPTPTAEAVQVQYAPAGRVPILMYHHIAVPPAGADAVRCDLSVLPASFADQMHHLAANGYQAIGLGDLAEHLIGRKALPARPIIITFDDGYDDNYDSAYPILRRHGFTATFFIIADLVGQAGYMSWGQIAEMSANGMSLEAHGRSHRDLARSDERETMWQIAGSKTILEAKLGRPVRFYAYPSGGYRPETIAILRAHGFVAAVSTAYGATHTASDLFELSRIRIRGADTLQHFSVKLTQSP